jgi:hypothetical protein
MASEGERPGDTCGPSGQARDHTHKLARFVAAGEAVPSAPALVALAPLPPDLGVLVERLLAENGRLIDRIREQVEEIAHLRARLRELEQPVVPLGQGD